jgi:predicted PolB exonuclease-like 3'-5' exonuclease
MKPFVVDIETGPRPDSEACLPQITAPANYKDEAKRASYVIEKRSQLVAEAALDAALGQILCVGILRDGEQPQFIHNDENETDLLRNVWHTLEHKRSGEVYVTFNGHRFDFPYLARRSFAKGVTVPSWFPRDGRFPKYAFNDLAEVWSCGDRSATISLDRLAVLCGLPGKSHSGADFARLWKEDRKTAFAYLENDLRLTQQLWFKMVGNAPLFMERPSPTEAIEF